ncbi:MAG: altronate dehydratase [Planctomycetes bacterium]|nr:altronate dehydratase [Planctomycetota bacterium]
MSTRSAAPRPLAECAVVVSSRDNVAVVKSALATGERVALDGAHELEILGSVTPGHRFATRAIPAGTFVLQYGQPIGTSTGISAGEPISHANMSNEVPVVRELPAGLSNPAPDYFAPAQRARFRGFVRADGRVGTRNFVLIVPTSMCASHEAAQIAMLAELTLWSRARFPNVDGVVALPHNKGCGCSDGSNLEVMLRTLANYADHPNVGAVLFMDLGCEKTNLTLVGRYLKERGGLSTQKPVEWLGIQDLGGTENTIKKGLEIIGSMLGEADKTARSEVSAEHLVLGVKCGGSDGFSGLSANPALGHASDLVVRSGGTVMITEVPEFCGGEHLFAARAKDAATGKRVFEYVDWYKEYAKKFGTVLGDNPSPGNVAGGLLNITIKSLGAMAKAGTTRVEGCTEYAMPPTSRGLHLMQGPGYDQESTPGLVGAGANVIVFTTGRGTTIGNAIAPVIKLASNTPIFERMGRDLDLNAGTIIDGTETIEQVGRRVFERIRAVAGGEVLARAEETKHREFQFWAEQSVSL